MERDFWRENGDSSVSSALESLQCSPRPGEMKLNIKSFISRSRKVPEQPETSQAAPGCKGCCHFAAQAVTMSLPSPFKGQKSAGELGNSPRRVKFSRKILIFLARFVLQTSSHPCTLIPTAESPLVFPHFDVFVTSVCVLTYFSPL